MNLKLNEAKKLGNQFAQELQKELGIPLIWWFIGSIKNRKYISGKSDIDMVIIPKEKGIFSYKAIKEMLKKVENYKKYGIVFRKGREISLIDPLMIFNLDFADKLRESNKKIVGKKE